METQAIRSVERVERAERTERTILDRLRGRRRVDPLRETADGLGVVLDKLSESVTEVLPRHGAWFAGGDSEEGEMEAGRRTRGFKLRQSQDVDPVPASVEAVREADAEVVAADAVGAVQEAMAGQTDHEQLVAEADEVMDILRKARNVAAEAVAPPVVMPAHDRAAAQERLKELFYELSLKRIEIISSIFSGPEEASGVASLFSLSTPDSAKAAYNGIDAMIMKFLNAGRDAETVAADGVGSVYDGHEAALSATERLKEFLRNESPENAFMRFREVNRSNILGLLQ